MVSNCVLAGFLYYSHYFYIIVNQESTIGKLDVNFQLMHSYNYGL